MSPGNKPQIFLLLGRNRYIMEPLFMNMRKDELRTCNVIHALFWKAKNNIKQVLKDS